MTSPSTWKPATAASALGSALLAGSFLTVSAAHAVTNPSPGSRSHSPVSRTRAGSAEAAKLATARQSLNSHRVAKQLQWNPETDSKRLAQFAVSTLRGRLAFVRDALDRIELFDLRPVSKLRTTHIAYDVYEVPMGETVGSVHRASQYTPTDVLQITMQPDGTVINAQPLPPPLPYAHQP